MKTKIILLALLVAACLPAQENSGVIDASRLFDPKSIGITLFDNSAAKEVMTISGLAVMQFKNPQPTYDNGIHYAQPEKPDEVKIVLTTKDGKKWRATWVEEKP